MYSQSENVFTKIKETKSFLFQDMFEEEHKRCWIFHTKMCMSSNRVCSHENIEYILVI